MYKGTFHVDLETPKNHGITPDNTGNSSGINDSPDIQDSQKNLLPLVAARGKGEDCGVTILHWVTFNCSNI